MYQIVFIQIAFQSFDRVEVDFLRLCNQNRCEFKFRGTEKIELSCQGTYNFQIWENETLIIADY